MVRKSLTAFPYSDILNSNKTIPPNSATSRAKHIQTPQPPKGRDTVFSSSQAVCYWGTLEGAGPGIQGLKTLAVRVW